MSDNAQQDNATSTQAPALQTPTEAVNSGSSQSATVPQEHVSKLVGEARKEGKATAVNDLLKTLGAASIDEIKALIEDARKRKESDMTEAQKAQALADKVLKEKSDLEAQLNAERTERRNDRIASALTSAAGKFKANDTDDVLRYARDKHGEELAALIDDSGAIDQKKVDALMDKIKASKPHYFTPPVQPLGSMSNSGGRALLSDARLREQGAQDTRRHIKSNF